MTLVTSSQATASSVEKNILLALKALEMDDALDELLVAVPENWQTTVESFSLLKYIEAAGGVVQNEKGEYLFIRRHEKWDLPKGKLERGESIEQGAQREVEEECGIQVKSIERKLMPTLHLYYIKQVPAIKITYWYLMQADSAQDLIPQTEEDITEAIWAATEEIPKLMQETYPAIQDLMDTILERK